MIRKLLTIFLLCASAAATVTVRAKLTDGTGTVSKTAYLHFQLENCGPNIPSDPTIGAAAIQTNFDLRPNQPDGTILYTNLLSNDEIFCGGVASTYWVVTPMKDQSHPLRDGLNYVLHNGTTFDPSVTQAMITVPLAPPQDPLCCGSPLVQGQGTGGGGSGGGGSINCNSPNANVYWLFGLLCDPFFTDDGVGNFTAFSGTFIGPKAGWINLFPGPTPVIPSLPGFQLTAQPSMLGPVQWQLPNRIGATGTGLCVLSSDGIATNVIDYCSFGGGGGAEFQVGGVDLLNCVAGVCPLLNLTSTGACSFSNVSDGTVQLSCPSNPASTYRTCTLVYGADNGSSLVSADLGPQGRQCFLPYNATISQVEVAANAGTPSVLLAINHQGVDSNILSSALSTAAAGGVACSTVAGGLGFDGVTTCSSTLQNTAAVQGDYIEAVSGTASTAKRISIFITFTQPNFTTGGTVTSVGLTTNGSSSSGIFSASGSPVLTAGNLNFGITGVAASLPYFSATNTLSDTAALTDGQILIGSSTGNPAPATITAGTNVTVTNGHNTITIASTGGGGGSGTPMLSGTRLPYSVSGNHGSVTLCSNSTAAGAVASLACTATSHSNTTLIVCSAGNATPTGASLTYTSIFTHSGNLGQNCWWATVVSGASTTFSVAANGGSQNFWYMAVFELYGANASNPVDNVSAEQDFAGVTNFTVTGATTATAGELMFLVAGPTTCGTGLSSTSNMGGWSNQYNTPEAGQIYNDGNQGSTIFVRRITAATSNWTSDVLGECSSNWGARMFSIKP